MLVVSLVVNVLFRASPFTFGENVFLPLIVDVSIQTVPPNRLGATQRKYKYNRLSFQHSFLHRDEHVISDLVRWVGGELADEPPLFRMFEG